MPKVEEQEVLAYGLASMQALQHYKYKNPSLQSPMRKKSETQISNV
jgi:hypothetical protein